MVNVNEPHFIHFSACRLWLTSLIPQQQHCKSFIQEMPS